MNAPMLKCLHTSVAISLELPCQKEMVIVQFPFIESYTNFHTQQ